MKRKTLAKLAVATALATTLAGCTTAGGSPQWVDNLKSKITALKKSDKPEEPVVVTRMETDKPFRTTRELTISWDNQGRAGAANHQPAFVHVLGESRQHIEQNSQYSDHDLSATEQDGGRSKPRLQGNAGTFQQRAGQGYSYYELQRWERYCNGGKNMDERDWRFVAAENYAAPLDALGACSKPTYDYNNYLESWTRFCTSSPQYNASDKQIVTNTSRPYTTVNPCQALTRK